MNKPKDITPEEIQSRLKALKIKNQELVGITGCNKGNISSWINGTRPMSMTVKNMFYWFLKTREDQARAIEAERWKQTDEERYSDFKNGLSYGMK